MKGAVPPATVAVAVPLLSPLHFTFVLVTVTVTLGEAVIVTEALPVQPFLSVTVTE